MTEPIDEKPIDGVVESFDAATQAINVSKDSVERLTDVLNKVGGKKKDIEYVASSFKVFSNNVSGARGNVDLLSDALGSIDKKSSGPFAQIQNAMSKMQKQYSEVAKDMVSTVNGLLKNMNKNVSGAGDITNATIGGIITRVKQLAASKIGDIVHPGLGVKFRELEDHMAKVSKASMQTSFSIGEGMGKGADAVKRFNDTVANMEENFVMSREAAIAISKELSSGMGADATAETVFRLSGAYDGLSKNMNAAQVAAAVVTATGMDHNVVTNSMNTAYQELGASIKDSANIFGLIQDASEKSNVGFSKTLGTIMGGAKALKMWGGTVESVTPIYNAFAKSLEKGRHGLAPELFDGVIAGIQSMGFETKAFLGLKGGMGGAGGALQSGFEMEQALSEGPEGMKKIMSSVMDTMKQFGGGRITTLREAATDPEAARNYAIQRDLLGKLLNVTGDKANRTMDMLAKNQDAGLRISDNAAKGMESIVKGADQIASDTSTTEEKANAQLSAAITKNAETIKGELNTLVKGSMFKSAADAINNSIRSFIKTGQFDVKQLRDGMRGGTGKARKDNSKEAKIVEKVSSGKPPEVPRRIDRPSFKPTIESPEFLKSHIKTITDELNNILSGQASVDDKETSAKNIVSATKTTDDKETSAKNIVSATKTTDDAKNKTEPSGKADIKRDNAPGNYKLDKTSI